jgi:prolyl oligopeptidase
MSVSRGELVVVLSLAAVLLALLGCAALLRLQGRLDYPPAPRGDVVDSYHRTTVADPYRWLEDLDSPQTRAWLLAEAQLTQTYLQKVPARARIHARIAELYDYVRTGVPFSASGRTFYTSNSGQQEQSVLLSIAGGGGAATLALDPNALPAEGHPVVTGYVASRDGRLLAYGVSLSGSDWTDWHIRDLSSAEDLPDVLRFTKYYAPEFSPDGKGLYYSAFPAPPAGAELSVPDLDNALFYHALGTPTTGDRELLRDRAHRDWQFQPRLTRDGRWLVVLVGEGEVGDKGREDVYLLDLAAPRSPAIPVVVGFQAAYRYVGADKGRLYFLTSEGAENGRVVSLDLKDPAHATWQQVVGPGPDAIEFGTRAGVTLVGHRLIVRTLHDAHSRVTIYSLDGKLEREVALPDSGTALGFEGSPEDEATFYSFSNLVTPPTVYRYELDSGASSVFNAAKVTFDPAAFEQRQVFYRSKDGTQIPLWLAYRKGLRLNDRNPLLLYGYGGFGLSVTPYFDPARIAWLEMGGVFALANIRGGGEYGDRWHRQAIRTHKQLVFDDFTSAARWLIANRYTSSRRLAIYGRSNGGLLVGAVMTQHPELFAAAIPQVGVLDMLRFNRFGQGAGWEGDYGSPADEREFRALYAYSPVHNVHPGTRYPATMVITGDHDTRVMPMHSFKFTAALQAAQAGAAPILLAVDLSSGHGGQGSAERVTHAIDQNTDIYTFLVSNLGMHLK